MSLLQDISCPVPGITEPCFALKNPSEEKRESHMDPSLSLEPVNVTFHGKKKKKGFEQVNKDLETER